MTKADTEHPPKNSPERRGPIALLYAWRWELSIVLIFASLLLFFGGIQSIFDFSRRIDSMSEQKTENPEPKIFDTRTDIWFDPLDEGLLAYRDVEAKFIAEDIVIVAFEESKDPWGVFGKKSLSDIQELTEKLEKVPYVRNVRSLASSPWIRNGTVAEDESGLIVTDLFDGSVDDFSDSQRLERMIAVLGAEQASKLVGREAVQHLLGSDASFSDARGEPRFIDSIVSADGRTAAIVVQVIRQKPEESLLQSAFPRGSGDTAVASALHTIDAQGFAVKRIKEIVAEYPEREIHLTGIPVIEQHFPEVGKSDMSWLGLMFLVIGGALFLIYRKASGVFLPLAIVFGSILAMNGAVWLAGDLINNLTASAPIIMTAVGVADAVHLVTAYFLLRPHFDDKRKLIEEVIRKNALPVFLTSLTTVVAFLSLMVSPIIPVKQLGYTAAIGTTAAYLLSMTAVPAALSLMALPKRGKNTRKNSVLQGPNWTDRLADFIRDKRNIIIWSSVGILALAAMGLQRLRVESDVRLMFPSTDPVVVDQNWIEAHLGGAGDLDIVFQGAPNPLPIEKLEKARALSESLKVKKLRGAPLTEEEKSTLKEAQRTLARSEQGRISANETFLSAVDRFERRLESESKKPGSPLRTLTSFDSGLSVLRRMHQVQNEGKADYYRVPSTTDIAEGAKTAHLIEDPFTGESSIVPAQTASTLASQYLLQYENGAKPAENLSPFVSPDRRSFRIAARVKSQSSADMLSAYEEIRSIARRDFPELAGTEASVASGSALSTMRLSGKHYLFMNMMERFTATLMNSLGLALLVITIVIGVVFRSVRLALVSMVPNVMPLVVPLALFGLLGISLDGPAVIVATIALGICVDDTIHLLTKFQAARRTGASTHESIRLAFRQVGGALTWTSITLVLGFAVLSASQFRPNMLIGAVGAAMVALAWFADVIVTPALLGLVFPDPEKESVPSPAKSPQPAE